ncbi:MAG: DNA polymerase IV [Clostridiaceae bacterium]|jgi:DNA polymerase-4|nr:DNA polymerase IV [Clostridiaceae bacterium]
MERKILHVDQNCFFASVEMVKHPELRDVPMAVGGDEEKRHGIILAKNRHAAAFGVKTAEAIWQARQKCPGLVIVPAHHEHYSFYSEKLFDLYCQYTDRVEPYGLDECWLDLTGIAGIGDPAQVADEIRERVRRELHLTCSVGVSFTKIFAKLGSDYKKPDATTIISRENFRQIAWPLPVGDLLFVGRATQQKLARINIRTIGALAAMSPDYLRDYLGINGVKLWMSANGTDDSPVAHFMSRRTIKSVGNSTTTARDMMNEGDVWQTILALSDQVAGRLRKKSLRAQTIQIWARGSDLHGFERQKHLSYRTDRTDDIAKTAMSLFRENYTWACPVRSLGVRTARLVTTDEERQRSIFDADYKREGATEIETVIDRIRMQFGDVAIRRGVQLVCDSKLIENGVLAQNRGGFSSVREPGAPSELSW